MDRVILLVLALIVLALVALFLIWGGRRLIAWAKMHPGEALVPLCLILFLFFAHLNEIGVKNGAPSFLGVALAFWQFPVYFAIGFAIWLANKSWKKANRSLISREKKGDLARRLGFKIIVADVLVKEIKDIGWAKENGWTYTGEGDLYIKITSDWTSTAEKLKRTNYVLAVITCLGLNYKVYCLNQELLYTLHPSLKRLVELGNCADISSVTDVPIKQAAEFASLCPKIAATKKEFEDAREAGRELHYCPPEKLEAYIRNLAPWVKRELDALKALKELARIPHSFETLLGGVSEQLGEISKLEAEISRVKSQRAKTQGW